MTLAILLFAFATFGSKLLLALAIVWVLVPEAGECPRCDCDSSRIEVPTMLRAFAQAARLQWRWCPGCDDSFIARGPRSARLWVGPRVARGGTSQRGDQALLRRPQ